MSGRSWHETLYVCIEIWNYLREVTIFQWWSEGSRNSYTERNDCRHRNHLRYLRSLRNHRCLMLYQVRTFHTRTFFWPSWPSKPMWIPNNDSTTGTLPACQRRWLSEPTPSTRPPVKSSTSVWGSTIAIWRCVGATLASKVRPTTNNSWRSFQLGGHSFTSDVLQPHSGYILRSLCLQLPTMLYLLLIPTWQI